MKKRYFFIVILFIPPIVALLALLTSLGLVPSYFYFEYPGYIYFIFFVALITMFGFAYILVPYIIVAGYLIYCALYCGEIKTRRIALLSPILVWILMPLNTLLHNNIFGSKYPVLTVNYWIEVYSVSLAAAIFVLIFGYIYVCLGMLLMQLVKNKEW